MSDTENWNKNTPPKFFFSDSNYQFEKSKTIAMFSPAIS